MTFHEKEFLINWSANSGKPSIIIASKVIYSTTHENNIMIFNKDEYIKEPLNIDYSL